MSTSQSVSRTELRDFVDLAFARRLEAAETLTPAHVEALRRYWPEAALEVIAGGTAVFGGVEYPANRVEEFYRSRGVPCEIVVSPLADPSLRELLAPRGYRITEFNSVLIRRLDDCEPVALPEGVALEPVTASNEKLLWRKASPSSGPCPITSSRHSPPCRRVSTTWPASTQFRQAAGWPALCARRASWRCSGPPHSPDFAAAACRRRSFANVFGRRRNRAASMLS